MPRPLVLRGEVYQIEELTPEVRAAAETLAQFLDRDMDPSSPAFPARIVARYERALQEAEDRAELMAFERDAWRERYEVIADQGDDEAGE